MILARDSNLNERSVTIGYEESLKDLLDDLTDYYINGMEDSLDVRPYVAIVKGETFSGKTAFIKHFFDELR